MNVHEKQLLRAFRELPDEQKKSLLDYAEFLASRTPQAIMELILKLVLRSSKPRLVLCHKVFRLL